jgi:hypothetical protein
MKWISRFKDEFIEELKRNPFKLIWLLIWMIPVYACLFLLGVVVAISDLSIESGLDVIGRNLS